MKPTLILILPLLASSFQDAEPPNARTTLERGAYVEEYERDLEKAENLYTLAAEVARAQGDEATAKAAAAALERVKARRAGAPAAAATLQDEAIVERIGELIARLQNIPLGIGSDNPQWASYVAIRDDLAVYGDAVVPWLEQLLSPAAIQIGDFVVQLDTRMAARMLARMRSDAANAALARALQAKDPLIRRAVAEELSVNRHRSLLEQAVLDPVPQVREAALSELMRQSDPALLPLIEPHAAEGHRDAVDWMLRWAPERLLEMLGSDDASAELLDSGMQVVSKARPPATPENADVLLRLAREGEEDWYRTWALGALRSYFQGRKVWGDAPPTLRHHVQERLLAEPERYPRPESFELLAEVGDLDAFELLSRELMRWPADRPQSETQWLLDATRNLLNAAEPGDFQRLSKLYGELPLDPSAPLFEYGDKSWHDSVMQRLRVFAKEEEVSAKTLATGYEALDGPRRGAYHEVVRAWVDHWSDVKAEGIQLLIPAFREMLKEDDWRTKSAASGLFYAGDVDSLPRIIELDEENGKFGWIGDEMCKAQPERAGELIEQAVLESRISPGSIAHLGTPQDLAVFDRLWGVVEDAKVRKVLLETLAGKIGGAVALERMVELYPEMSSSSYARHQAIERFGEALYEPAIPILGQALEDPSQGVRMKAREAFQKFKEHREALEEFAAWTLGDRAAREQVDELIKLLKSDDEAVVIGAVKALGAVRGRAALPELVRLLERDDEELRAAVYEAIERIGR